MFGGRFVYKVECTVGATVGGVARGSGPTPGSPHAAGLAGAPVSRVRVWATRAAPAAPAGSSPETQELSAVLCSLFSCISSRPIERPPYRVRLYLAYMELLKETALEEACHPRAAITLEVRLGVRLRHVCVLA